ncbi:MAG: hypothetical protein ACM3PY_22170 [Omnitrophica WOR_2 bacterium]
MRSIRFLIVVGFLLSIFVSIREWQLYWASRNTAVFTLESLTTLDGRQLFLQKGDTKYIHDRTEMPLDLTSSVIGALQIGQTQEGLGVYEVKGQPQQNFVFMFGPLMDPAVFRNVQSAPLTLKGLTIQKLELYSYQAPFDPIMETDDPHLIQDVYNALLKPPVFFKVNNPDYQLKYHLFLVPLDIPGLAYDVNIYSFKKDKTNLYFTQAMDPYNGIRASEIFTNWVINRK